MDTNDFFNEGSDVTFDIIGVGRRETENKLRLVDVETFHSVVVGIADVQSNGDLDRNTYMFMKPRKQWPDVWKLNILSSYNDPDNETDEDTVDELSGEEDSNIDVSSSNSKSDINSEVGDDDI